MRRTFTFHNVSINTTYDLIILYHRYYLHSTMFLLIPLMKNGTFSGLGKFTFHNVSINTMDRIFEDMLRFYLHSTMFLLIRIRHGRDSTGSRFTFHNVSINTYSLVPFFSITMFIYIPQCFY